MKIQFFYLYCCFRSCVCFVVRCGFEAFLDSHAPFGGLREPFFSILLVFVILKPSQAPTCFLKASRGPKDSNEI